MSERMHPVKDIRFRACSAFSDPVLSLDMELDLGENHILIDTFGKVDVCTETSGAHDTTIGLTRLDPNNPSQTISGSRRRLHLLLPLTRMGLEAIEETRMMARHQNVFFKVLLILNVLRGNLEVYSDEVRGKTTNVVRWALGKSGGMSREILIEKTEEIAQSRWVNEFQPVLGLGKYVLVEIPLELDETLESLKKLPYCGLAERLTESTKALNKAQLSVREGKWRNAIRDVRDSVEIIEKGSIEKEGKQISVKKAIRELILKSDLPEDVGSSVTNLIDQLKTYTNATHHTVDRKGETVDTEPPFDKEDAIFAFGTTAFILNMLAQKAIAEVTPK